MGPARRFPPAFCLAVAVAVLAVGTSARLGTTDRRAGSILDGITSEHLRHFVPAHGAVLGGRLHFVRTRDEHYGQGSAVASALLQESARVLDGKGGGELEISPEDRALMDTGDFGASAPPRGGLEISPEDRALMETGDFGVSTPPHGGLEISPEDRALMDTGNFGGSESVSSSFSDESPGAGDGRIPKNIRLDTGDFGDDTDDSIDMNGFETGAWGDEAGDGDAAAPAGDKAAQDAAWKERLEQEVKVDRFLGAGGQGAVWIVTVPADAHGNAERTMVAKMSSPATERAFQREKAFECDVPHALQATPVGPNVMDCTESRFYPDIGRALFLLTLAPGKDLSSFAERDAPVPFPFTPAVARHITEQVLGVVRQMSEVGLPVAWNEAAYRLPPPAGGGGGPTKFVHHDLKPANLVVDPANNWHVTVIDFGATVVCDARNQEDLTPATAFYRDPDCQSRGVFGASNYMLPCSSFDTYAAGAILFEMVSGEKYMGTAQFADNKGVMHIAWRARGQEHAYDAVVDVEERLRTRLGPGHSVPLEDVEAVKAMVQLDSSLRPAPSAALAALERTDALERSNNVVYGSEQQPGTLASLPGAIWGEGEPSDKADYIAAFRALEPGAYGHADAEDVKVIEHPEPFDLATLARVYSDLNEDDEPLTFAPEAADPADAMFEKYAAPGGVLTKEAFLRMVSEENLAGCLARE